MSTSFTIQRNGKVELAVDEHSNKLDIVLMQYNSNGDVELDLELADLSPEQLSDIGKRFIEIAEYYI